MRIGFFTDTFLPQTNGVVTAIISTGSELVRRGHEVTVFCPRTNVKELNGMRIFSYPAVKFRPYPDFMIAIPQGRDRVPELDVVHTHSPFTMGFFGWRVSRWQGIPRIATFHTLLSEYSRYVSRVGKAVLRPVTWEFCRVYYNRHRRIIAPSRVLKDVLREHRIKRPISVIPSGIDLSIYRPIGKKKSRKKLGLPAGDRVFLSLGRLGYEKKVDVIIKAFEKVEGKLIIAGRGPAGKKLRKLRDRLGLRKKIKFVGHVPEELKPLYYSAADAFLIASCSETQGLVMVEAMACRCPVIGADALAISEVVEDGRNGFLFRPNDPADLGRILNSFEPSRRMSSEAVKTGRKYSVRECVRELEAVYEGLVTP
ncbi:MAG: glycosyltransferase [Candidatus Hadarchaeales archaeon]